jgi:hypothetical protein
MQNVVFLFFLSEESLFFKEDLKNTFTIFNVNLKTNKTKSMYAKLSRYETNQPTRFKKNIKHKNTPSIQRVLDPGHLGKSTDPRPSSCARSRRRPDRCSQRADSLMDSMRALRSDGSLVYFEESNNCNAATFSPSNKLPPLLEEKKLEVELEEE